MKKNKTLIKAIFTVLLLCSFLTGCEEPETDNTAKAAGKVFILQAYGNAGGDSPAGVSHSFVELYNVSGEKISLDGITLYFANGTSVESGQINDAIKDEDWKKIALTGTIPAKGSYLILGAKHDDLTNTRYKIEDGYGDINDDNLSLSRRGFKAALIGGTEELTVQNPFDTDGNGAKVSGYIDMVGAANDYRGRDLIFGFETAPARNSASEAIRRADITDTNDNLNDFPAARYASDGMSDEELEARRPRNSAETANGWEPFAAPADEYDGLPPTTAGAASDYAGKLLILQIGASADDDNNISHSFVELYNAGTTSIDLNGITLQYAAGTKVADSKPRDGKWQKIELEGTIEAGHSFLIIGAKRSTSASPALNITDNGDMNIAEFKLDNRAVKAALIQSANLLTVQNPFNMDGQGGKAAGYIDMIGVTNDNTDQILGWEGSAGDAPSGTAPFRITKQVGVRRTSLTDTDINKDDFETVTYANLSTVRKEIMRPKNHANGSWDPLEEPVITGTPKLMILQANTYGNANGGYESSLVELYNNTENTIDLDDGNYYLHIGGTASTGTNSWAYVIKLEGTIPPQCSFLIRSTNDVPSNVLIPFLLPEADQSDVFAIINDDFKVALLQNQNSMLSVANPFDTDGAGTKIAGYVDMLGVRNATGFETQAAAGTSRPQPVRRTSLADTDNNREDFAQYDNRSTGVPENQLYKYWPRNSSGGAWNPITGNLISGNIPVDGPVKRNP